MIFLNRIDIDIPLILRTRGVEKGGKVQKYIDSEVIRKMDPYTPLDVGTLKSAPLRQTTLGSGEIVQQTPYAKRWYYTQANFSGAPMRGMKWFDRMKESHKRDILKGAAKIAGGRGE